MKKVTLTNGLTIILEKKPTQTITIQATVKTGSNNENKKINGISHFMEHMLFEGTKKRPNSRIIVKKLFKVTFFITQYLNTEFIYFSFDD